MTETTSAQATPPLPAKKIARQAKIVTLFVVVLVLTALLAPRGDGTSTAPAGFLLDATGRPSTLGDHFTEVVLLHFWATWCPPCITEIPALERLGDDFSTQPGFQIMMVAVDDDPPKVAPFVGASRAFAVLFDPQWEVAHRYGTRKLPETYVILRGKKIESLKFVGAQNWDDPQLREILKQIIQQAEDGVATEDIVKSLEKLPAR
jgi:thiol-disulfide isomerase/thioredoxin